MSIYTPPALNAVDFALTAHTVPSIASPTQVLSPYSVPALTAVNFSLIAYTQPTYPDAGWELLPGGGVTITGTLAATDSADTAAFAGDIAHVGTLAATDGADTAAMDGVVATPTETTPKYSGLGYLVDDGKKRETITLYDEEAEILELLAAIMPVIQAQQQRRSTI